MLDFSSLIALKTLYTTIIAEPEKSRDKEPMPYIANEYKKSTYLQQNCAGKIISAFIDLAQKIKP